MMNTVSAIKKLNQLKISYDYSNSGKKNLIVFLPSVRSNPIYPYYPRISWKESLSSEFDLLYIADPYQNLQQYQSAGGSWFIAPNGQSILPEISDILHNLITENNYQNILLYGSSMGGYASLILGALIPDSVVIAECPQLFLDAHPGSQEIISLFCCEDKKLLLPDPIDLIKKNNGKSEFYFILNLYDHHVRGHIIPYINRLTTGNNKKNSTRINIELYSLEGYQKGQTALKYHDAKTRINICDFSSPRLSVNYTSKTWKCYLKTPDHDKLAIIDKAQNTKFIMGTLSNQTLYALIKVKEYPNKIKELHSNWIRSGNTNNAKLLIDNNCYNFNHYGEINIGSPINWYLGQPNDNNLSWQLHSMGILRDLITAHIKTEDDQYISYLVNIIFQWEEVSFNHETAPEFSWNDHTTALRLTNLCHAYQYLCEYKERYTTEIRKIITLIEAHQKILLCNDLYSKGTNHGLDQSYSLYISSIVLSYLPIARMSKSVSLQRLTFELNKSYSSEFVHIENSPEYHEVILSSTLQINNVINKIEAKSLLNGDNEFVNGSLKFLTYILRPDGCLPPIGDSTIRPPNNKFKWLSSYEYYSHYQYAISKGALGKDISKPYKAFKESGYFVFKGCNGTVEYINRFHLIFKCGFLSHYHRQDDDNNILLYAYGEEWLTDGGLYKHDHGDEQREFFRSHLAHNIMFPVNEKAERRYCPSPPPRIINFSENKEKPWVEGSTSMFKGFQYNRRVEYNGENRIIVLDRYTQLNKQSTKKEFHQLWYIPFDKKISISNNTIVAKSTGSSTFFTIKIESDILNSIELVSSDNLENRYGWRSTTYGILEKVHVICVKYSPQQDIKVKAVLSFN